MSEIATVVLPFFGLIAMGFGASRWLGLPARGVSGLHLFLGYFAMPAWFFHLVASTPFPAIEHWSFLVATGFATYCAFAIAFSLGALLNRGNVPDATVEGLAGSYANIGFLAPALTVGALGPAAGAATALVFVFDHLVLFSIVPLMMVLGGTVRSDRAAIGRDILRRLFVHPLVIAALAGLLFSMTGLPLPGPVDGLLALLGGAAPAVALFAVGAGLARRRLGPVGPEMPGLLLVKLVLHPLIVYLLLTWIGGYDSVWVYAAVLMAALPPAVGVVAVADRYGAYRTQAVTVLLIGTAASVVTLTAAVALVLLGALPANPYN